MGKLHELGKDDPANAVTRNYLNLITGVGQWQGKQFSFDDSRMEEVRRMVGEQVISDMLVVIENVKEEFGLKPRPEIEIGTQPLAGWDSEGTPT